MPQRYSGNDRGLCIVLWIGCMAEEEDPKERKNERNRNRNTFACCIQDYGSEKIFSCRLNTGL